MDILRDSIVITRRTHKCTACGRKFEAGTRMRTQVYVDSGDVYTWRECPTCQELLSKHRSKFEDDYENTCCEFCVKDSLKIGQTPEQLLDLLNESIGNN